VSKTHGDESLDTQSGTEAEVFDAADSPVRRVRPVTRGVSKVQAVPHLSSADGQQWADPGREKGELVSVAARNGRG